MLTYADVSRDAGDLVEELHELLRKRLDLRTLAVQQRLAAWSAL